MDYSTELKRINDKYYHKIKKEYSKYIKNFDSIPDLTQNVYIIPDNKCIDDYEDLAVGKNRGRCDADTGNIYIRESAFCDHLLIHEFIHRLSRNKTKKILFPQKILGIATEAKYIGINEIFTEYLSSELHRLTKLKSVLPTLKLRNKVFLVSTTIAQNPQVLRLTLMSASVDFGCPSHI